MVVKDFDMVETSVQETEGDRIAAVLAHEEALTRIQDKKLKAIERLDSLANTTPRKLEIEERKLAILEEKWEQEKELQESNKTKQKLGLQSWKRFSKRKAKRKGPNRLISISIKCLNKIFFVFRSNATITSYHCWTFVTC